LLRHLIGELVRVVIVIPEVNCRVSLACHFRSFLRTVFLGGLEVEGGWCIGRESKRDCRFALLFLFLRSRILLSECGGEQIRRRSFSRPTSKDRNNSGNPKNQKQRTEEKKRGVFH
jgi:hypothetical protein